MIVRKSPAKVNLFLKVLRKREDGYHDIATLMQRISIYDEMRFSLRGDRISVFCPGSSIPEDEGNIAYRAAEALFSYVSYDSGVEISIVKTIPEAAGLGGGSSNAATTLVTLNELLECGLSAEQLMTIGATIGADVPFFIFQKTAWAFGIGDQLYPAEKIPQMWFVVVNPGFEVSTKKVYESLKFKLTNEGIKYTIPRFLKIPDVVDNLYNDLEEVTVKTYPVLLDIKEFLLSFGALGSLMSGSGPTVFGIFSTEDAARAAADRAKNETSGTVFVAHSL